MGGSLSYPEVDLSGKVAIVTGGNTGIGYETAKSLARMGAHTFIACRSKERAEAAIKNMMAELSPPDSSPGQGQSSKDEGEKVKGEGEASGGKEEGEGGDSGGKEVKSEGGASGGKEVEGEGEASGGKEVEGEGEASGGKEVEGEGAASGGEEGIQEATNKNEEDDQVKSKEDVQKDSEGASKKKIEVDFLPLDLSSFQSVTDFVRLFKEKSLPLHILVNNAAVFAIPYRKTGDGIESHLQVNHLSPVLLTLELLPILLDTASSSGDVRIIFVSSQGHSMADSFSPDNLEPAEASYKRLNTYNNTKQYNIMTGFALQRRLQNSSITVSSLNPGFVNTEANRGIEDKKVIRFFHGVLASTVGRTPAKGAATSINCAVNPALNSQQHMYYSDCKPKVSSVQSRDEKLQEELWRKSFEYLKDRISPDILETYGPKPVGESVNEASKPDEEASKPDEEASKPDEEVSKPDKEASKPDKEASKPDEEASKPDEEVSKPDEESSKPDEEASKPDEEASKPDEEASKPDEEISKPDEEASKPDEEVSKPDEEASKPDEEASEPDEEASKLDEEAFKSDEET